MPRHLLLFLAILSPLLASPAADQLSLGDRELDLGHGDAAIAAFEKAVALDPTASEPQRRLGDAYGFVAQNSGMFTGLRLAKKVRLAYEKAVTLDPASLAARESLLSFYLAAPGMLGSGPDKSSAQAAAIRQLDPAAGHLAYARVYVAAKDYAAARRELDDALAATPDSYAALYQVGRLAAITGEAVDRGIVALQKCLALAPTAGAPGHEAVQWRLGNLCEKKGDRPAARTAYESALKLKPGFEEAAADLKRLGAP
jgi:tetratricopeptide (TPR) repeat protein